MNSKLTIIATVLSLFAACNEQPGTPELRNQHIVFGHFYGFCHGESCIEIFKLTESSLFEDENDQYPSSAHAYQGKFIKLEDKKFQLVKDLFNSFPEELLTEKDTTIGSPDAADGGGIYFAVQTEEGQRYWLIDQMKNNVPEYLHPFMDYINSSIKLISE